MTNIELFTQFLDDFHKKDKPLNGENLGNIFDVCWSGLDNIPWEILHSLKSILDLCTRSNLDHANDLYGYFNHEIETMKVYYVNQITDEVGRNGLSRSFDELIITKINL